MLKQAALLVGGKGTRLGSLTTSVPKPLLLVGGQPFLNFLIDNLRYQGVDRFVLLASHLSDQLQDFQSSRRSAGLEIELVVEPEQSGTGGALAFAADYLEEEFFVCNGDSLFDVDLSSLVALPANSGWVGKLALRTIDDASRYGTVSVEGTRITDFAERGASAPGLINGGTYVLRRSILDYVNTAPCSIELDIFPRLADEGKLFGLKSHGYFIDIGIPDDLARAQSDVHHKFGIRCV